MANPKLRLLIIGAGGRGLESYGNYLCNSAADTEVVGVADPDLQRLDLAGRMFPSLSPQMRFNDWRPLLKLGKIADAVIIATLEPLHAEIAIACAKLGYHILLEKPM